MNGTSYLVAIDGSEESRSAAYFTWDLATQSGSRIVAQHVIDSPGIWRFLSYDLAGFVGSGLYMEAREQMVSAMYSIGEGIMMAYASQVNDQVCQFESCIDDGDPATEIARRAQNHDLVVVGLHHRHDSFNRPRMFEKLAEVCSCPVLVVRNTQKPWSRMQVFITDEIANQESIAQLYQLSAFLGLPCDVYFDETISDDQRQCLSMSGWSKAFGVHSIEQGDFKQLMNKAADDVLIVISAGIAADQRTGIRDFLERSDRRALLLWRNYKSAEKMYKLAS